MRPARSGVRHLPRPQDRPEGMKTVLRLRSAYGEPRKALTDPERYIDERPREAALKRWTGRLRRAVHRVQGLLEIRQEVVRVLDADGDPDRRIGNPEPIATCLGTPEWVVDAGWQASDSVPPRLTASLTICSASRTRNASTSPPLTSNENVEPAPVHCDVERPPARASSPAGRPDGEPSRLGVSRRNASAICWALWLAASMRSASVSSERPSIQHECGSNCVPIEDLNCRIGLHEFAGAKGCTADKIGMPADIFRQRVHRKIRAVLEGTLKHRTEQRVVADQDAGGDPAGSRSDRRCGVQARCRPGYSAGWRAFRSSRWRPGPRGLPPRLPRGSPSRLLHPRNRPTSSPRLASVLAISVSVPP